MNPDRPPSRTQRRHRFLLAWMLGTALWISTLLIAQTFIRPAPVFAVMAPLAVALPALALILGFVLLRERR